MSSAAPADCNAEPELEDGCSSDLLPFMRCHQPCLLCFFFLLLALLEPELLEELELELELRERAMVVETVQGTEVWLSHGFISCSPLLRHQEAVMS